MKDAAASPVPDFLNADSPTYPAALLIDHIVNLEMQKPLVDPSVSPENDGRKKPAPGSSAVQDPVPLQAEPHHAFAYDPRHGPLIRAFHASTQRGLRSYYSQLESYSHCKELPQGTEKSSGVRSRPRSRQKTSCTIATGSRKSRSSPPDQQGRRYKGSSVRKSPGAAKTKAEGGAELGRQQERVVVSPVATVDLRTKEQKIVLAPEPSKVLNSSVDAQFEVKTEQVLSNGKEWFQKERIKDLEKLSELIKKECPDSPVKVKLFHALLKDYRQIQEQNLKLKRLEDQKIHWEDPEGTAKDESQNPRQRNFIPAINRLIRAAARAKSRGRRVAREWRILSARTSLSPQKSLGSSGNTSVLRSGLNNLK